jgi:hypothetical protein
MGLGGPLAAEISILNTLVEFGKTDLSDELRFSLKKLLKNQSKGKEGKFIIDSFDVFNSDFLSEEWLNIFFPTNQEYDSDTTIKLIKAYHEKLAPVSISSTEKAGGNS